MSGITIDAALLRLAEATIYGGIVILLILIIRAALGRWLAPRWVFLLWLIALVRLILPVAPIAPFSIFATAQAVPETIVPILVAPSRPAVTSPPIAPAANATLPIAHPAVGNAPLLTRPAVLALLWFLGATALTLTIIASQLRLARMAAAATQICDQPLVDLLQRCKARLGIRAPLTIAECPRISSPLLLGSIRPILLLPPGLAARLSEDELRSIIMHELAHIRRADIAIGWGATLVLIIHWFNPLVWLALARMRADRELACDALALAAMQDRERPAYGRTLIALLEHAPRPRPLPGLAAIAENNGDIKRRITMVARFRPSRRSAAILPAAFVALVACISLTDGQPQPKPTPPVARRPG
jgi:beta-lactamase regulating signal transducer with metallopeptidase domain